MPPMTETAATIPGTPPISRIREILPYFNLLYFFEIFYLMILLFFIGGKAPALLAGAVCTILLTWHILMLYYRVPRHRKIQLYLMDIHLALAAASIVRLAFWGFGASAIFACFMSVRILIALAEPFLIYYLTGSVQKASP